MSTANKLQYLIDAKISISAAIEAKGGDVPQELSGYGPAISALPSGGGDLDKLTYVLYEDNKISGYLLEGSISGETTTTPYPAFQNGKVVQLGNAVTEIGTAAFWGCSGLTSVTIPDSVTSIGSRAFYNCSDLSSVTIGNGLTSIGWEAFSNCSGLTSVTIPDGVTSIGRSAFQNCYGLTSINIPDGVTRMEQNTFSTCSSLLDVSLPDSVTMIGSGAFRHCYSLSNITLGNALTSIATIAFSNTYSCLSYDFSRATVVPTLARTDAFNNTNPNKKIIVPDALYETWKTTQYWNSTTNGIVDAITKASEA